LITPADATSQAYKALSLNTPAKHIFTLITYHLTLFTLSICLYTFYSYLFDFVWAYYSDLVTLIELIYLIYLLSLFVFRERLTNFLLREAK